MSRAEFDTFRSAKNRIAAITAAAALALGLSACGEEPMKTNTVPATQSAETSTAANDEKINLGDVVEATRLEMGIDPVQEFNVDGLLDVRVYAGGDERVDEEILESTMRFILELGKRIDEKQVNYPRRYNPYANDLVRFAKRVGNNQQPELSVHILFFPPGWCIDSGSENIPMPTNRPEFCDLRAGAFTGHAQMPNTKEFIMLIPQVPPGGVVARINGQNYKFSEAEAEQEILRHEPFHVIFGAGRSGLVDAGREEQAVQFFEQGLLRKLGIEPIS
jgi:hypothetical protein